MRWETRVAFIKEIRDTHKVLVGKSDGKGHLEELGVDLRIILERLLKKSVGKKLTGLIWLRIRRNGGLL
jgi:hypothetical protein